MQMRLLQQVLQDPPQTLFAHGPRWDLREQERMQLCYSERGMLFLEGYECSL